MNNGVAARLASIRERMAGACHRAGRAATDVILIGAGKRQPDERLQEAAAAGLTDFGENQVQEAEAHSALLDGVEVTWHLIGPLQSNKTKRAAALFHWIHSVDRLKIARRLDRECRELGKTVFGFAEVNLGAEASKHGFSTAELEAAQEELLGFERLRIVGLMAIPPMADSADGARQWFRELRRLRDAMFPAPGGSGAGLLSMGMSADFEIAIEEGATHIRIGTDLFGARDNRKPR